MKSTDLVPLLTPSGDEAVGYRQGIIVTFDPATLANTVQVDGQTFTNLPILGVAEAVTLTPGSTVGIHTYRGVWYIVGRIVTPGSSAATEAVSLLANSFFSEQVDAEESTSSATFGDLATVGPTVAGVRVGPSGRALVILTAAFVSAVGAPSAAVMGFEVSGASTLAPDETRAAYLLNGVLTPGEGIVLRDSAVVLVDGLNPGVHTFEAKYASTFGNAVSFGRRNVTVLAL